MVVEDPSSCVVITVADRLWGQGRMPVAKSIEVGILKKMEIQKGLGSMETRGSRRLLI